MSKLDGSKYLEAYADADFARGFNTANAKEATFEYSRTRCIIRCIRHIYGGLEQVKRVKA